MQHIIRDTRLDYDSPVDKRPNYIRCVYNCAVTLVVTCQNLFVHKSGNYTVTTDCIHCVPKCYVVWLPQKTGDPKGSYDRMQRIQLFIESARKGYHLHRAPLPSPFSTINPVAMAALHTTI